MRFWAALLAGRVGRPRGVGVEVVLPDEVGFALRFAPSATPKAGRNLVHLDLTSTSVQQQRATVDTARGIGARHADVGQRGDEGHVVLADVEGNEFCVIEPGNRFLAGCGVVGALACDGTEQVGRFWAAALGWPLVWDRDEETAIQSPRGGPKISWGGPPLMSRAAADRVVFELVPTADSDTGTEIDRLLGLGATRRTVGPAGVAALSDPDGNLFRVRGRG